MLLVHWTTPFCFWSTLALMGLQLSFCLHSVSFETQIALLHLYFFIWNKMAEDPPLLTSFCFFSELVLYEQIFGGKTCVFVLYQQLLFCVFFAPHLENCNSFFLRPKYSSFTSLAGLVDRSLFFRAASCCLWQVEKSETVRQRVRSTRGDLRYSPQFGWTGL